MNGITQVSTEVSTDERDRLLDGYLARLRGSGRGSDGGGLGAIWLDDATLDGVRAANEAALTRLVSAHVATVSFENARVIAGKTIRTDPVAAVTRIVDGGGGGLCFELNGALSWLLEALGVQARLWAAEVRQTEPGVEERYGIHGGHAFIEVDTDAGPRLLDVGFGGEGIVAALPAAGERVTAPSGRVYRAEGQVDDLAAFAPAAAWHSTSPDAKFRASLVVSRASADATRTLAGVPGDKTRMHELAFTSIITRADGSRERRTLTHSEAEQFARTELGFTADLPTRRTPLDPAAAAPTPPPVHRI